MRRKRAQAFQKEVARRTDAVTAALRGEESRRWPWMLAAFCAGTAIGGLIGVLASRAMNSGLGSELADKAQSVRESVSSAAERATENVRSATEDVASGMQSAAKDTQKAADEALSTVNNRMARTGSR